MNIHPAPKLPDAEHIPTDWPGLRAHYFQCLAALEHSAAEMRRHADCPRYGPVVGPRSASGGKCIQAGILLCRVMERDLRQKRWRGPPEAQNDLDVLIPRVVKARRALEALT